MASLSISQAWEETKSRIAVDGKLMMAVALATVLLPQAIVTLVGPPETLSGVAPPPFFNLLVFIATVIGIIGQLAIVRLAIGPATSVGDAVAHGAKRFLPAFAAMLILAIALFVVAIVLVLVIAGPGDLERAAAGNTSGPLGTAALVIIVVALLIGARFLTLMPTAAAEPGGPIHILKRSWSLAGGHYLRLLAFVIMLAIAVIILTLAVQLAGGSIIRLLFDIEPFSIGALLYGLLFGALQAFYALTISVMLARIYLQLAGRDSLDVTVPSSGT